MNKKNRFGTALIAAVIMAVTVLFTTAVPVQASAPTDEITDYTINAHVRDDGTVELEYHIEWLVLDSDKLGPLSWVEIGLPNSHTESYSHSGSDIRYMSLSGSYMRLDLIRAFYEGETAVLDFTVIQDYMYEMNRLADGYTLYEFTPGWFDEIAVDNLTLSWDNSDGQATEWTPAGKIKGSHITWTTSLAAGETYTVTVTYPNDAFDFDTSKMIEVGDEYYGSYDYYGGYDDSDDGAIGVMFVLIVGACILVGIKKSVSEYSDSADMEPEYETKITRTKIEYWPECQGCGAVREEGQDNCKFCGRSFIKSEEVIKEENIPKEDKEVMRHTTAGTYRYTSLPNTYVRVNVVRTPIPHVHRSHSSSSRHSGRGGGCAHSSCACASHCACACACACAGGGRAGCSAKDFYNTNLKLRQLDMRAKSGKKSDRA